MLTIKQENDKLKNKIDELRQKTNQQEIEIQQQLNNIEQSDQDQQMIMQQIRKLLIEREDNRQKRIKQIIERIPSQMKKQSLQSVTQSIIVGVVNDLKIAYKNAYNENQNHCKTTENQSLVESFLIIGVKHKQILEMKENRHVGLLKPKILYKQFKQDKMINEREFWIEKQEEIKKYFQNSLIVVEKLYDNAQIKNLTERQQEVLQENSFIFNLNGSSFDQSAPKNVDLLTHFNHNKQLFVFVQGVDDYITNFQNDGIQYWKCKKYYCFLTYFPIPQIFDQLLKFADNLIQGYRLDTIKRYKEQLKQKKEIKQQEEDYNKLIYQDVDAANIIYRAEKDFKNIFNSLLDEYLDFEKPELNIVFNNDVLKNFGLSGQKLTYSLSIPQQIIIHNPVDLKQARNQIRINNLVKQTHFVLQIFDFDNFFSIFQQILREEKIAFYCSNINILTSVCYFFHQIIYPYIWLAPVIYYSNQETLNLLIDQAPFILGINLRFSNTQEIQNLLKKSQLMIVELKIGKKKDGYKVSSVLHQQNKSKYSLDLRSVDYYKINKIFQDYKTSESNFQTNFNQEQSTISQEFLYKMMSLINEKFIQNIVPISNPDFTNNGWNKLLIKNAIQNQVKQNQDKDFIIYCISVSEYFQEYLKQKYNFKEKIQ